ncbi:hypothetical protein N665_0127s0023 [Sinapis alba]|nr:hypothetical protein N665_0127s0023 [Sinapis alba]
MKQRQNPDCIIKARTDKTNEEGETKPHNLDLTVVNTKN